MYKNILVADDIRMNRTLVIDILRQKFEEINFFEAKTGIEALEIIENNDIDLIILDLIMPEMDGYEVLNRLTDSCYSDVPVIVSSAVSDIESIEQTLMKGANDYFTKPLSLNDMSTILPLKVKNLLMLYEQKKLITKLNENIKEELNKAIKFQTAMLPKSMETEDLSVSIKFKHSNIIGGDFFDYVKEGNKYYFIISNISKCGIIAGMASSMLKMLFRMAVKTDADNPKEILKIINDSIREFLYFENQKESEVCLDFEFFIGVVEDYNFSYINKNHTFPVFYMSKDQETVVVDSLSNEGMKVLPNDVILLYTDGIFPRSTDTRERMSDSVKEYTKNNVFSLKKTETIFLKDMFHFFDMLKDLEGHYEKDNEDATIMAIKIK